MRVVDTDKLRKVLDDLSERTSQGIPVIVEGKRDRLALERLGVTSKIFTITMPLEDLAETVAKQAREAIILTDYDRRGRMLAGRLKELLMADGVTPHMDIRFELEHCTGLEYIEELPSLLLKVGFLDN